MSNTGLCRSVVLKRRPKGEPTADDFEIRESPFRKPALARW